MRSGSVEASFCMISAKDVMRTLSPLSMNCVCNTSGKEMFLPVPTSPYSRIPSPFGFHRFPLLGVLLFASIGGGSIFAVIGRKVHEVHFCVPKHRRRLPFDQAHFLGDFPLAVWLLRFSFSFLAPANNRHDVLPVADFNAALLWFSAVSAIP